ncbi:MAG: peptidylprolyl isomerase [Bacteroidota bacterium]
MGAIAVTVAGCTVAHSESTDDPVAAVADLGVDAEAFRTFYIDYLLRTGVKDSATLRRTLLQQLVTDKLYLKSAFDNGIQATPAYETAAEQIRQKVLLDAYAEAVLYDTLTVDEAEVRAMFVRANTTLEARHLYAHTQAQAELLRDRLDAGETFEALAAEVFADPQLAATGGSVGTFEFDEMDPAFEEAAYQLAEGEISDPVKTAQGYSVIQLTSRFTKPLITETEFQNRRDNMTAYVRYRKQIAARQAHTAQLREALAIQVDDAGIEAMAGQISGQDLVTKGELSQPIVQFIRDGQPVTWTLADFREAAQFTDARQRAQIEDEASLRQFVDGLVVRAEMLRRAEASDLISKPAVQRHYTTALDDWVVREAKAEVRASVVVPEDSVAAYFERYREEYTLPVEVEVREVLVDTKAEAEQLRAKLSERTFADLAAAHSLRPGAASTGGSLGFVRKVQLGRLGDMVFGAAEGDVLGPVEIAGRYALLQVGPRRTARAATYEDVAPQIRSDLRAQLAERAVKAKAQQLRQQYPPVLYLDRLDSLQLVPHDDAATLAQQ